MRAYVKEHPGRYEATEGARPTGSGDPLIAAAARVLGSWAAMLRGYQLGPGQEIHAMRILRSILDGFSTLEVAGGFQIGTDVEDSFTWMIDFIDQGLQATARDAGSRRPVR